MVLNFPQLWFTKKYLFEKFMRFKMRRLYVERCFYKIVYEFLKGGKSFHTESLLKPNSGKINLDREDLFFFFASVAVFAQTAMDDNNSVYVGGLPYDITDEALPYAYKEKVYENSHGFERRDDDVLDRNGYKEKVFGGGEEEDWRGKSGPIKNIKKLLKISKCLLGIIML
ncbi:unnamed protein product [Brassica rapa subsp. narinosa]|uniref:(rape) hypothetical protein n=1 Tax=Brassica napus TaxID=3708 RepID=A0A816VSD4_BRANA|nr:unnamed protein product [Brassica napus]